MNLTDQLATLYREKFGHTPAYIAHAPGRVNLLGEHVDYNDGFVQSAVFLEASFFSGIAVALSTNGSRMFTVSRLRGAENILEEGNAGWPGEPARLSELQIPNR